MYSDMKNKKQIPNIFQKLFHRRTKRLLTNGEVEFQKFLDIFTVFFIIFLISGIFFVSFGNLSSILGSIVLGIAFIILGFIYFIFFRHRREFSFYRIMIVLAIASFILAILTFCTGEVHVERYCIYLGISFFIPLVERLIEAFYLGRVRDSSFWILIVSSIVMIFLAIVLFINPFDHLLYREVLGIFIILSSILNLTEISLLNKKISEFVSALE